VGDYFLCEKTSTKTGLLAQPSLIVHENFDMWRKSAADSNTNKQQKFYLVLAN
jgi:hypothetical protein